jgi:biotin carboxyl carrier protein
MNFEFVYNGETKTIELKDNRIATFPDSSASIEIDYSPDGRLFLKCEGRTKELHAVSNGEKTFVDIEGVLFEFVTPSDDAGGAGGGAGVDTDPSQVFAPMPGKIVKMMVSVGDAVEPKQHLVIVEAMKMEHIVMARAKGTVRSVNFAPGDQADTDTPIIELDLAE